jgi:hypothetical protein
MTLEEAKKVVDIMATADGGCSVCVGSLFEMFQSKFPEFVVELIHVGDDGSLIGKVTEAQT